MITNSPRQSGKTTRLVTRMAQDDNLIYVAPLYQQCQNAFERARELGFNLDRTRFVKFQSGLRTRYPGKKMLVDEAHAILDYALSEVTGLETAEAVITVEMEEL